MYILNVCKLECSFLDVTTSIFLHLHGLDYVSYQIFGSFIRFLYNLL
jgi:hypothetical protein